MKRIIFYTGVALVAIGMACVFVTIFLFLVSIMTAMIAKSKASAFTVLFFIHLFLPLFLILTGSTLFAIGFFVHRADLFYRMRTRAFKVLRSDSGIGYQVPAFPPAPYFPGVMPGVGCFVPGLYMPFMYGGLFASPGEEQDRPSRERRRGLFRGNKGGGNKRHLSLVGGGGAFQDEPPEKRVFAPGFSPRRGDNIRPFPKQPKNRRKR
jgi:hypothetical protein